MALDKEIKDEMVKLIMQEPHFMGDSLLCNDLQEALWSFMKGQLERRLEVKVVTEYAGLFPAEGKNIRVKLMLDGEVISVTTFTLT